MADGEVDLETSVGRAVRLVFGGEAEELSLMLTAEIAKGADPSFNNSSPLHVAVGENEVGCIDVILEVCAEAVLCRDVEERTPLHHCSTLTSGETVAKLAAAGTTTTYVYHNIAYRSVDGCEGQAR